MRFLDNTVRNDVKVEEILCSGWFRKGMDVYALFKDGTITYLGMVTSTNYYGEDGDMFTPDHEEDPEVDVYFDDHDLSETDKLQTMRKILKVFIRFPL